MTNKKWEKIGVVGVDSGRVWIGDPCYFIPDDRGTYFGFEMKSLPKEIDSCESYWKVLDERENCFIDARNELNHQIKELVLKSIVQDGNLEQKIKELEGKRDALPPPPGHAQFNYDHGGPGLGISVSTLHGDGLYPVFVKRDNKGRVRELKVVFDEDVMG